MYVKAKLTDTVRVPPEKLGDSQERVLDSLLREKLEGKIDRRVGMVVAIIGISAVGEGRILTGDGGVYYDVTFDCIAFRPVIQEIVEGRVVEVVEFGAFVSIGPMDALLHVSQISDDFMTYDEKNARLVGRNESKVLQEGDLVRARIVAVSLNEADPRASKIGLTMRQPTLGKLEWVGGKRPAGPRPRAAGEAPAEPAPRPPKAPAGEPKPSAGGA
ncbi:MAG: DNA-directed RNA polymerase [Halobacteria archaeon]